MGIRVQPLEVEVPKDDPFKYDLLDRKESAETLTNLIGSLEGPCVMGIDAPWGAGKTTFLKMWAQHMRKDGFPVVEFNAWETDFSQDPFIALATELENGLRVFSSADGPTSSEDSPQDDSGRFDRTNVNEFSEWVSQATVQILNQQQISNQLIVKGDLWLSGSEPLDLSVIQHLPTAQDAMDSQPADQTEAQHNTQQAMQGQNIAKHGTLNDAEARRSQYRQAVKSFASLRNALETAVSSSPKSETRQTSGNPSDPTDENAVPRPTADASRSSADDAALQAGALEPLSEDSENAAGASKQRKPFVVFIDELDRCRPTYAIELLEVAKHLFAVDGVVFVLGVNRSELAKSVKAVYGDAFDAEGYLRRFFNVHIRLPHPDRKNFIGSQLQAIGLHDFLARTEVQHVSDKDELKGFKRTPYMCSTFFSLAVLSLRDIEQAIHRLGLLLALLRSDGYLYGLSATVLLILRTLDRDAYNDFISGQASDREIIEKVFSIPGMDELRYGADIHRTQSVWFQTMIIIGSCELQHPNHPRPPLETSEMLAAYSHKIKAHGEAVNAANEKKEISSSEPTFLQNTSQTSTYTSEEIQEANWIVNQVPTTQQQSIRLGNRFGFAESINRLKLIWTKSSSH